MCSRFDACKMCRNLECSLDHRRRNEYTDSISANDHDLFADDEWICIGEEKYAAGKYIKIIIGYRSEYM